MKDYIKETIKFYDEHADHFFEKTKNLQDLDWLTKFISYLPKNSKILEVGCAFGRDAEFFVKNGFETYGIDLSKNLIEKAKKSVNKAIFKVMNVLKLDFPNNYFDGIWCGAILLHLNKEDIHIALKEIKRVLKKDGVLFIGLKKGKGEKMFSDVRYHEAKKFYSYFEEDEIKEILNTYHFSIIEFEVFRKENNYDDSSNIHVITRKV